MSIGPVEYIAIAFPGNKFSGEIIPAIQELQDNGTIRVLDLVIITNDADGPGRARERAGLRHHPTQQGGVRVGGLRAGIDVILRDDHEVHGGHGVDVVEGEHVLVLVELAARDLPVHDLAVDAVALHGHAVSPLARAAFSSMPARPSLRPCSSSTSSLQPGAGTEVEPGLNGIGSRPSKLPQIVQPVSIWHQ